MAGKAKTVREAGLRRVLRHIKTNDAPERGIAMVQLSFKAGLRACEIAGLTWEMVLTADRKIAPQLTIESRIAKNGSGRSIPIAQELRYALLSVHNTTGWPRTGPVIRSQRGGHMTPRSVVNWFTKLYTETGLEGCSSHSGRRTFITRTARLLAHAGGSLKDVQELAGHRALTTTEGYIEGDRDAQRRLIRLL